MNKPLNSINDKQAYYDFMPSAIAVVEKPPAFLYRLVSWLVIAFVIITLLWLFLAKTDIVVTATGKIVPAGKVKVIQSATDGVVKEIFVRDGQAVKSGDPLIEINDTTIKAEQQQLQLNLAKSRLTIQRLKKELGDDSIVLGDGVGQSFVSLQTQESLLSAKKDNLDKQQKRLTADYEQAIAATRSTQTEVRRMSEKITFLRKRYEKRASQAGRGLIPNSEAEDALFNVEAAEKELAIAQAKVSESKARARSAREGLNGLIDEHRSSTYEALAEAEFELDSIKQELVKVQERLDQQVLRSPVDGVIQQLEVNTVGGYLTRAEQIMVVVPENTPMELNATILSKDIGFVALDQEARVKVDSFEYTRYGYLQGDLQWIGSDSVLDEQQGFVYPARIALKEVSLPNAVNGRVASVVPGMSATVDVVIGQRRLMNYFIGPLLRYRDESLRER